MTVMRLVATLMLLVLTAGTARAADCTPISDTDALRRVLALPVTDKAGQVYCLAPGRYADLEYGDFAGAFTGIDPARPVTFKAADPAKPPVLNTWMFVNERDKDAKALPGENGDVILRDLSFDLSDDPIVPLGQLGFKGHRVAVYLAMNAVTRNVTIERIHVTGPLTSAQEGGRESEHILEGVHGGTTRNITVRDSRFERILNAIVLAGTDLTVEGNRMRHSWGDLVRIVPQVTGPDGACDETARVTVRNNMVYDHWASNRMHPDVVQMFAASGVSCSIRDLLIEGNLAFPGEVGLAQPGHPTGFAQSVPKPAPAELQIDNKRILHRLIGPGTTQLPPAVCPNREIQIAVQLDGTSGRPVTLVPPPGTRLAEGRAPRGNLVLDTPWATWRMTCRPDVPGTWNVTRMLAGLQGIFTNPMPRAAGWHNVTIRYNILWTMGRAMDFRDTDDRNFTVTRNSFLRNWPGDLNGDGKPNTYADGFNEALAAAQLVVGDQLLSGVSGNVTTAPLKGAERGNDAMMQHKDGGRSLTQRFATAPGPRLMPTTPAEAVALARPKPGGLLDGKPVGAVAARPQDDPYDWSWVTAIPW